MELQRNMVGWFEIPVTDMDRAIKFYETVLNIKIQKQNLGDLLMGWFPYADVPGSPGSLVYHKDFYKPSGGKVLMEKKLITEDIGYMGLFTDTEGNRIAINSRK